MKDLVVLGVDVGGTNIKFGLVNSSGRIFARSNLATALFLPERKKLIQGILDEGLELIHKNNLKLKSILGIGIGLPGLVNMEKGIVHDLPNIPGWKDVPLKRILEKKLGIRIFIDNDVKLITLSEWKFGAGRGEKNMVCVTLGTGVGSGLVLNNQLYRGEGFAAGELGHVPINVDGPKCNCGGWGCFERYVGNKYLLEKAEKMFNNKNISLEELDEWAGQSNEKAMQFWREVGFLIGTGLVSVVNLLNPRRIVIGGGIANAHRHLFPSIQETIKKRAMSVQARMVKIVRAKLGNDAGIIGAQVLVHSSVKH